MKRSPFLTLGLILLLSFLGSQLFQNSSDLNQVMSPPSWSNPLGTDGVGRDVALRLIQAVGVSMLVGSSALGVAILIGFLLGGLAGWKGGVWDLLVMRIADLFDGLPDLLVSVILLLIVVAFWEMPEGAVSIFILALAMGVSGWPRLGRQVRALVLQEKEKGYAQSALSMGVGTFSILYRHLLPNLREPLIRFSLMHLPGFVLYEGSLSFFGLGVRPPTASLGLMLQEGWRALSIAPHLVWAPAGALFILLMLFEALAKPVRN